MQRTLVSSEGSAAVEKGITVSSLVRCPVVAGEEDEGVLLEVKRLQSGENNADLSVDLSHGGRVLLLYPPREFLCVWAFRDAGNRRAVFVVCANIPCVGSGVGEVEEEWLFTSLREAPEVLNGLLRPHVTRPLALFPIRPTRRVGCADIFRDRNVLLVAVHERRVVVVAVGLVGLAEEIVETHLSWISRGVDIPQPPLADQSRGVARVGEDVRNCDVSGVEDRAVRTDRSVATVPPGHQSATRWRTHRGTRVGIGEAHAFFGQLVKVWSQ
mmetsp:Transcript_24937/g.46601  ORF Transcript_24937/g.46601 Transcript_24937/m.46601 type:complete len:270 (+) Transcript_24937:837-1646(+)